MAIVDKHANFLCGTYIIRLTKIGLYDDALTLLQCSRMYIFDRRFQYFTIYREYNIIIPSGIIRIRRIRFILKMPTQIILKWTCKNHDRSLVLIFLEPKTHIV